MSHRTPLVSVIMPFYNCAETLAAAIHSVRAQTFTGWELLLCDDGSTDNGLKVARDTGDDRVVVWSAGGRKGLAARLNECIDRARGEYIARMDADDIAYPERLARQVEFLESRPDIDLVGCQMLIFGDGGIVLGKRALPLAHEEIVARPAIGFGIGHPTWLGRTAWFRRFHYNPQAIRCEDADLLRRSYPTSRFANLPEILYGYRETRFGFRKRLKTRLQWVRMLKGSGEPGFRQSALIEPAKALVDAVVVGTGLRYALLKAREQRPTDAETDRWRDVLSHTWNVEGREAWIAP